MILEAIMTPLFALIDGPIFFLPDGFTIPNWGLSAISLLSKAMYVFPADVWFIVIGNIVFWLTIQMGWAIIEWIYRKIPGIT